jgi:hypothetical protein
MQPTIRVLPPVSVATQTMSANTRAYSANPGQVLDVPAAAAPVLLANGWSWGKPSGPTSSRPPTRLNEPYNAYPGFEYVDTSLGLVIVWDGATWRNPVTGAAV